MPRQTGSPTSLDRELIRMAQAERMARGGNATAARGRGVDIRAYRQFFPDKAAAKETRKVETGIKLNGDTITIHGQTFTREQFKAALDAIRADPNSAYRNACDPNHKQAVAEMNLAYKGLAGELSDGEMKEIIGEWNQAEETTEVGELLPHQEIAQIIASPEGRIAKQRRNTGQPLDARQAALMKRHDELLVINNTQARREQASKGGTMSIRPPRSIGRDVQTWLNNPHKVQRQQLAAEYKAKTLANPNHDYWHPERGTLCDNAKLGMKIAYEVAETGDCHGVQIGPDGSISEGE